MTMEIDDPAPSGGRPKRKTAVRVNYKESGENDDFSRYQQPQSKPQTKQQQQRTKPQINSRKAASPAVQAVAAPANGLGPGFVPVDDEIPMNWQPATRPADRFNHILDLTKARVENNALILRDGTQIKKNDHIYMVCEPPGEPYYIARITGIVKKDKNNASKNVKNFLFRVCWFYRPRDLNRQSADSRLLYATLHSDECPIQSFRGMVTVKHKSEIKDMEAFRATPNCFFFDKLYDRYMMKMYEVLPTAKLVNLTPNYYKALNKRYEYVIVEVGRSSDLLTAPKNCEKCSQWCSTADSIDCHRCGKYYHMLCLDPPIYSKPRRGFGWYCAKCSRDLEIELSEKRGKMLEQSGTPSTEQDSEESVEESMEEETVRETSVEDSVPKHERMAVQFLENDKHLTQKQRRDLEEWPYRYLGVHARFEDALDLEDRPYPLAASRLGSRHQCTGIPDWFDHPVQYYDKPESKSKNNKKKPKSKKKSESSSPSPEEESLPQLQVPDEFKDVDPEEYPPWLQERPKGYIERGGDDTATLMWRQPETEEMQQMVETYIANCARFAEALGLLRDTPNFMDAILKTLHDHNYDPDAAIKEVAKFTRESLKEPTFSPEEVKRFENAVKKHGSELYPVYEEVKTQTCANIVRFYYLWKKTPNGHAIWDNFPSRPKNKVKNQKSKGEFDDSGDDSSYDKQKVNRSTKQFECKHCHSSKSIQWFRASGVTQDNKSEPYVALCFRCARLWRRYGVVWEDPLEVTKKQPQKSTWKRKVEAELYEDAERILAARAKYKANPKKIAATSAPKRKMEETPAPKTEDWTYSSQKKLKADTPLPRLKIEKPKKTRSPVKHEQTKDTFTVTMEVPDISSVLKKEESTLVEYKPETKLELFTHNKFDVAVPVASTSELPQLFQPHARPCCVCRSQTALETVVICRNCGLNVHASCYGVDLVQSLDRNPYTKIWYCDACTNDASPAVSTQYSCSLCHAHEMDHENGLRGGKSSVPDALKRTDNNKWCHVICSLFAPEVRYGNRRTLQPVENVEMTVLKNAGTKCWGCHINGGSLTKCHLCYKMFHVTCAMDLPGHTVKVLITRATAKVVKVARLNLSGKPEPIVLCDSHSPEEIARLSLVDLREVATRFKSQEVKTVMEWIFDDKTSTNHLTGPRRFAERLEQLQAFNKKQYETPIPTRPQTSLSSVTLPLPASYECSSCHSTLSLGWFDSPAGKLCHICHSRSLRPADETQQEEQDEILIPNLLQAVRGPLNGAKFGVASPLDRISQTPPVVNPGPSFRNGKVSISDLLD